MAKIIAKPIALAIAAGITLGGSFGAGAPAFAQGLNAQQTQADAADGESPEVDGEGATQVLSLRSLRNSTVQREVGVEMADWPPHHWMRPSRHVMV